MESDATMPPIIMHKEKHFQVSKKNKDKNSLSHKVRPVKAAVTTKRWQHLHPNWLLRICAAGASTGGGGGTAAREAMQTGVRCDVSLAGPPGGFLRQRPLHSSRLITHFNELNY